jgi:serine/threonine-protein kinase SRPK3
LADSTNNWSDTDVYLNFGEPQTETVSSRDGSPLGPNAPAELVEPIEDAVLANSHLLQKDILVIDFGQSFSALSPPIGYVPATIPHFQSPEAHFAEQISSPSDIWSLACTMFEICAGFPLFETFLGGYDEALTEIVATFGKLPEPWWDAFENRNLWFDEDGNTKAPDLQQVLVPVEASSIREKLSSIGQQEEGLLTGYDGPMMAALGTRLDKAEAQLLADLLEKMLRYQPQDRIRISEVAAHPWFSLE